MNDQKICCTITALQYVMHDFEIIFLLNNISLFHKQLIVRALKKEIVAFIFNVIKFCHRNSENKSEY